MDAFRQWAVSLITAGFAGTVISLLSPRGTMEKTLRAVIGIFIVATVISPIAKLSDADILPAFAFEKETVAIENDLGEYMLEVCKNTVGKVISEAAKKHGVEEFGIDADMYIDENGCIIIQKIRITIQSESAEKRQSFSAELEEKLGIPVAVNSE